MTALKFEEKRLSSNLQKKENKYCGRYSNKEENSMEEVHESKSWFFEKVNTIDNAWID